MEELPIGKPLTLRITRSPTGQLIYAISDPQTHARLFTGPPSELLAEPGESTSSTSSLWDKLSGKKDPEDPEPVSQA